MPTRKRLAKHRRAQRDRRLYVVEINRPRNDDHRAFRRTMTARGFDVDRLPHKTAWRIGVESFEDLKDALRAALDHRLAPSPARSPARTIRRPGTACR